MTVQPRDEAREALLTDYLDGAVADAELEALLAEDPEAAEALDEAREARRLLEGLAPEPVPRDFLRKVKRRVRRRSGGRYFHPAVAPFTYRISVEVFAVIAIAVMAACYLYLEAGRRVAPEQLHEEPPIERPLDGASPLAE